MTSVPIDTRKRLLEKVSRLVQEKHFDPALNGANWSVLVESHRTRILEADTIERLENEFQEVLSELKTSHTGIFHRSLRRIPARFAINANFQRCPIDGAVRWMFQDVHEGGAAHAAGLRPGDILVELNGKEITPPEAPVFTMGDSAAVTVQRLNGEQISIRLEVPTPKSKKRPINQPRPVSCTKLPGNIGFLKITTFPGAVGIDVAHDIDQAIARLKGCERLIVDLRGNSGGGIGGLRLMSYLTPDRKPVGYSLTKKRRDKGYRRGDLARFGRIPSRKIALIGLMLRYTFVDKSIAIFTEGLGAQPFHGRIVLLVNQHSASAAEMVAGFVRENRLATIVGTQTPGRLLSGGTFKVGDGFVLGLPTAAYVTWRGALLEGKGIEPDRVVELSRESLRSGQDNQLEKAVEVIGNF